MPTALITGAGSVCNAWKPIHAAVERVFHRRIEDVNCLFAREVFALRWIAQENARQDVTRPLDKERIRERLDRLADRRRVLQTAIAEELTAWENQGKLQLRCSYEEYVEPLLGTERTYYFTTNWDRCLEAKIGEVPGEVQHIHGCRTEPEHLYLPAEVTDESYRDAKDREHARRRLGRFMKDLGKARRVVLYGLSLSALDAELGVALEEAWSDTKRPDEFVVVDKSPQGVIDRLRIHIPEAQCRAVLVSD